MSKQEFLAQLRKGLSGLPKDDIDGRLMFYEEMIDDRIEEGLSEEEAVSAIGPADKIIEQTVKEIPLAKIAKERIKPKRRLKAWEIVLLSVGSPIWFSLGIAAAVVILSLYVSLWAVIISLWAVFVSFFACFIGGIVSGTIYAFCDNIPPVSIALIACGIVFAGLSIFAFFGCKAATKGILILTKKIAVWIKNCFIKKEGES
ncbi:MAG: DUF1700 domain-containing protein [Clostridia bacterium]|nr:DUF1700 domain-containing protein [Clostridia bacterium]